MHLYINKYKCQRFKRPLNHVINTNTNQYGEPMKDFLLANVAVIWAETPKSAKYIQSKIL